MVVQLKFGDTLSCCSHGILTEVDTELVRVLLVDDGKVSIRTYIGLLFVGLHEAREGGAFSVGEVQFEVPVDFEMVVDTIEVHRMVTDWSVVYDRSLPVGIRA